MVYLCTRRLDAAGPRRRSGLACRGELKCPWYAWIAAGLAMQSLGITLGGHNMRPPSSVCRELPVLLICVAAVALLPPLHGTTDQPEPDGPSAKQIVDRMAKAYAE